MKQLITFSFLALALSIGACQSKNKKETASAWPSSCGNCKASTECQATSNTAEAGVYYFHGDRKCKTCKAVGTKAKEIAESLKVKFFDINFDKENNKELAKTFHASSSGLYIKSSKSGEIQDLTIFAFRNALNDTPAYVEKLQTVIKAELQ
ncbi:nitrophenyl compound nitroreductase subunit ArsF family protein [Marinifilum sp.]|uniref:nitrophenyl compound nitroreductase subunit ArsF family protein n=1 Tax=Marinifilum sp. TaxID=2033137 RepID=UPI003BA958CA